MPVPWPSGPQPGSQSTPRLRISGRDLFVCAVLAAFPIVAAYYLVGDVLAMEPPIVSAISAYMVWSAVYGFSLIGAVWLVFVRRRGATLAQLDWIDMATTRKLLAIAIGWAAFAAVWAVSHVFREFGRQLGDYSLGIGSETRLIQAVTLALLMGIIAPFAEELFYRGVLFRFMRQRLPFWTAAIASSILFGLAHVQVDAIVNAAVAGILFAALYERSGSLLMPTIAHQTWNTTHVMTTWLIEVLGP